MNRRTTVLVVIPALLLGSFALAQTTEDSLELFFQRNPMRAIWNEMRNHSLESAEQGEALAGDLESLQGSIAGIGGTLDGVAASQALAEAMQLRVEPSCAARDVASVQLCRGLSCEAAMNYPCAPFACDGASGTCRDHCSTKADCSTGSACNQAVGQCVVEGNTCADAFTVQNANGTTVGCGAYRCLAGSCQQQCGGDSDCKQDEGYRCVDHSCERP